MDKETIERIIDLNEKFWPECICGPPPEFHRNPECHYSKSGPEQKQERLAWILEQLDG